MALLKQLAPYLVALLLLTGIKVQYDAGKRREGQMAERLRVADSSLAVAVTNGARLAVRYDADTATFRAELARWQAMKQRLRVVVESLPPDTVPGPERIVVRDSTRPPTLDEILAAADTVIQRCSIALGTCEERIGNLTERLRLTEIQRDAWKQSRPSVFGKARTAIGWAAVGFLIGVTR
jgi:hypothetical protein